MSRIRTNLITNRMANGAPTVSHGLVISGVTTVTTIDLNGDLDVDGHLNADNVSIAGVVTATSFVGSGANLTGITQTTINTNADNRIITGSGTANTLNGEANLTYDGTDLTVTGSNTKIIVDSRGSNGDQAHIQLLAKDGSGNNNFGEIEYDGDGDFSISSRGTGSANNDIVFKTTASNTERLRIFSDGKFGFGTGNSLSEQTMAEFSSSTDGGAIGSNITIRNTSTNSVNNIAELRLKTAHGVARIFKYNTSETVFMSHHGGASDLIMQADGASKFKVNTNGSERLRIDSSGNVMIGRTAGQKPLSVRKVDNSSGVHIVQTIGGNSHVSGYAVGLGFDPEGYEARNKIAIVAEGTGSGYSRGKLHFLLDEANDSGEASLSESRMTISDQGYVTKPSQPSFAAYKNASSYGLNNQIFPLDSVKHNIGSHYNTGNYRFTAPVAGRYLFTFYSILNSSVNSGHYEIRVNNSSGSGQSNHFTTVNSHWDHVSSSHLLNLNANDYVTMWSNSNVGWHGGSWQLFCGELLS